MAEISSQSKPGRKGFSKNRITHRSTRVDLTPMVDLGFLLITFFVFTTSLNEAKGMDFLEPKKGDEKIVRESGAMTFLLSNNHRLFYYNGQFEKSKVKETNFKEVRSLIVNKKKTTELSFLMYIIKGSDSSTFGDSMNLIDEMSISAIEQGHYAEVDITKEESIFLLEAK